MIRVGITGGIGSGKSTVCGIFKSLGIPVYHADERAKTLVQSQTELKQKISAEFGPQSYLKGVYNKSFIASIIFNNEEKRMHLNSLIHPYVFKDWTEFVAEHPNAPYLLKEAAIMFETESYKTVDQIIMVYAPDNLRIQRILERDQSDMELIRTKMAAQMPEAEKMKLADYVILNDGKHSLIEQVLKLDKDLRSLNN